MKGDPGVGRRKIRPCPVIAFRTATVLRLATWHTPGDGGRFYVVKFQQRYQMRHRESRDEDARWGFNSAISGI